MSTLAGSSPLLQRAMHRHIRRTQTFARIIFGAAGALLLVPAYLAVDAALFARDKTRAYCREHGGYSYELHRQCMKQRGWEGECSQYGIGDRFSACNRDRDACGKAAVSDENVRDCERQSLVSGLGRAGAVAVFPAVMALVGFLSLNRGRSERRRLAAGLEPGRVRAIEPYLLQIRVAGATYSEKIVLKLHLRDGASTELSFIERDEEGPLVAALVAQNEGCEVMARGVRSETAS